MFKIFRTVANNMSEGTYLKSVNNLEFKNNALLDDQSNNQIEVIPCSVSSYQFELPRWR